MRYFGFVLVGVAIVMFGGVTCYGVMGNLGWHLASVHVTVTRADTGRPERGVVVAATWTSSDILSLHGELPLRVVRTAEAVTGGNGLAVIPGEYVERKWFETIASREPRLVVYKRGFVTGSIDDGSRSFTIRPAEKGEDLHVSGDDPMSHATEFPRLHLELNSPRPPSRTPPAP